MELAVARRKLLLLEKKGLVKIGDSIEDVEIKL